MVVTEDRVDKAMKQAKASIQIEGFQIKEVHSELIKSILRGEISELEFKVKALEIVGK